MVNKVTFVALRGCDRPSRPPFGSAPEDISSQSYKLKLVSCKKMLLSYAYDLRYL